MTTRHHPKHSDEQAADPSQQAAQAQANPNEPSSQEIEQLLEDIVEADGGEVKDDLDGDDEAVNDNPAADAA